MNANKRPISLTILACVYLAVGVGGFAVHFRELLARHPDAVGIEVTELTAIVCGVFLLQGQNWARCGLNRISRHPERFSRDPGVGSPRFALFRVCVATLSSRGRAVFSRRASRTNMTAAFCR